MSKAKFSTQRYPISDHFDGLRFFNACGKVRRLKEGLIWWLFQSKPVPWPQHVTKKKSPFVLASQDELSITFIGHSTLLLQLYGKVILTDPIWSKKCAPMFTRKLIRVTDPGLELAEIPKVDLILLSHNHYDHCDRETLCYLQKRDQPTIITGLGNRKFLSKINYQEIHELDWWDSIEIFKDLKVTYVPAQHFSGRTFLDYNKSLWGGFVIESRGKKLYFAADTGYCAHFSEIKRYFGQIDISFLPIGIYEPRALMNLVHMSPQDAVQAHLDLESVLSIGIHFGCFHLGDEGFDEPKLELVKALQAHGLPLDSFITLEEGNPLFV